MKAISAISSLSPGEKNFLKTKQLTAEYTPDEWLKLFKKLKDVDAKGDSMRKVGGSFGCLGIILAIVSIFLFPLLLIIAIPVAIAGIAIYFYLKAFDIPGEILSRTLVPMIVILREEMKPDEKLKLRLDLRGFELTEKLVNKTNSYAMGVYHSVVDSFYRDHWLDGDTILADRTRLIWSVEDLVKSTHKTKRNYRGKTKSKTKNKYKSLITLQVGMNNKKYFLPEKVKQKGAEGAIRTKDADDHSWMNLRKIVKHQGEQKFTPQDFVNAVASAYARAIPASGGKK